MAHKLNRLQLALKTFSQLGSEPLLLYGVYRLGLITGHYRRLDARQKREASRFSGSVRPLFPLPEPSLLANRASRQARASLLREADAIASGRVRLFGHAIVPLQLAPKKPVRHWTEYERHPSLLLSYGLPHGDIKFLWEPARFGWAFTLGRAFHLSGRGKYAQAFWKHFERFDRANAAYLGPHWMNAQEVAIRLMALVWSAQVFSPAGLSTPTRMRRLVRSIALHAARIPPTLVYARSQNNNHLVTEATALYLAGAALDHADWRDLGWRWLNRALQTQISSNGEYIQHSTNYHRLMLQSALLADAVRRGRRESWPVRTEHALARASHWLFALVDPVSGRTPNLGANDGALILPLSSSSFEDFRPTAQASARAFLRTGLSPGDWDEISLWLGLPEPGHTADADAYAGEHLRNRDSWAYLRASSFKSRLTHMDQLHLDLWWRGLNLLADAGTYLYNAAPPWDNPLVSSRVHNNVTVDGREQMTRGGRFLVLDYVPASSRHVLSAQPPVLGQMTANLRPDGPVPFEHERTLSLLADGRWTVIDSLRLARGVPHSVCLHWLLLDGEWRLQQRGSQVRLRSRVPGGWFTIVTTAAGTRSSSLRVTLVRAGKLLSGGGRALPYEGWISPSYGTKAPALSFTIEAEASNSCTFTTELLLPR